MPGPRTKTALILSDVPDPLFWSHVTVGDCWEWGAYRNEKGYGQVRRNRRAILTHRYAWELLVGPIPPKMRIDHRCRNHACCNPDHLEVVTHRVNTLRGFGPTAMNAAKTVCKRGHHLNAENTYVRPNGYRMCRACARG